MRVGLVVSKRAREALGDQFLKRIYEESGVPYLAEYGDYLKQDVRDNDLQGLLLVSEMPFGEEVIARADELLSLNPFAVELLPVEWLTDKGVDYRRALILAYLSKLERHDLAYRLQPVKATTISRRSLIRFKLYEYKAYPVLFDPFNFEREINTLVESCPKGLIARSIEGVSVTNPSDCSGCGYCTAKGYLGYLEMPNFTTDQFVTFVNSVVRNYPKARGLVFTGEKDVKLREDMVPLTVPSVASIPDSFVMASFAAGLTPVIVVPEKPSDLELKRLEEIPDRFPGTELKVHKVKKGEIEKLTLPELGKAAIPEDVPLSKYRRRSLYAWALEEMARKVGLNEDDEVPGVYYVEVDPSKCVLCGVCVRACQMMVPDMRTTNDITYLEYNIPFCIGSQRCVRNCPENAIRVERLAKVKELKRFRYVEAKVLRCKYCGKPIGNVRIRGRVDDLLDKHNYNNVTQYTDVCNDCKQKVLTKMWLENYLKLRGQLK